VQAFDQFRHRILHFHPLNCRHFLASNLVARSF